MVIKLSEPKNENDIITLYYKLHPELDKKPFSVNTTKSESENKVFVAEEDGKIVGLVWVNFIQYAREKLAT